MNKVSLKICGITNALSVKTAHKNKIKSLGFASNNLNGPNTASDKKIQSLIKECKNYKIESVLLSRYVSLDQLIQQIDFTKPKTISCSTILVNMNYKHYAKLLNGSRLEFQLIPRILICAILKISNT